MNHDVLVYSEEPSLAAELLTPAASIAHSSGGKVVMMYVATKDSMQPAFPPGPDSCLRVVLEGKTSATPELAAAAIHEVCKIKTPNCVLLGSTKDGKEVAGRLAVLLDAAVTTECVEVHTRDSKVIVSRAAFGGRVMSTATLESQVCVVAVKPRSYAPPTSGSTAVVDELILKLPEPKVNVVKISPKQTSSLDLTKAEKIVSIGRGLKNKEDLDMIRDLAFVLDASVGCSRPLASDLGWLPEEAHIGLTGVQVKPKLYLAVGISGQLQHLAGVKESKVIVAINSDKNAPIFQNCDYGAVGDMYQVVPELTRLLKASKQ